MLEFNTALEKDVLVIELEGALDSVSAADFRRFFQDKTSAGYRAFALDCLCLEYISSAGIAAIIDLQSQLQSQGGKMVLFQLSTESRQLLRFLKLEDRLTIMSDYDDAIAALTGYRRVVPESDIVAPEELRIIDQDSAASAAAGQPVATDAPGTAASPPEQAGNEILVEEQLTADKKFPQPAQRENATVTAEAPTAAATPEAQELRLNTGEKRLISCPNCKSVLRVAVAGDYLCPACRFRFTFKPSG